MAMSAKVRTIRSTVLDTIEVTLPPEKDPSRSRELVPLFIPHPVFRASVVEEG
jgi:hypothetical protein